MGSQTPALPRHEHHTLTGHSGPVNIAVYAKGFSKYALSGGNDRTIRLWNPELGAEIKAYKGHGYEILGIDVTSDNAQFASSGGDRVAYLWDVTSGQTIRRFQGHMGKINAVRFGGDGAILVTASYDRTVKIYDLKAQNRSPIQSLDEASDSVACVYVSAAEIVTGSVDGHVRTYDIRKGELRSDYLGHPVTSIRPTKDGSTYLATTLDSSIRLMDCANGSALNTFKGHKNDSYRTNATFGFGEARIVCGDEDGRVWSWDLLTGKPENPNPPPKAHSKTITWTEQHPTKRDELLTASADGTVKVWRHPSPVSS
ncbi:nuclear mRNA splicing protein [Cantharellus anzutake]|uniref:nuclear mRNA splicing protein n=1 Tax=Cantharellus anzutake TaxID=1750568 RepID=UPI001904FE4B|nr:nuclear mRNA splicing protein [Cantharellus anzutake]KAF8342211.1 nuclear mRNA splicing protein [Cantharellus anzutake]